MSETTLDFPEQLPERPAVPEVFSKAFEEKPLKPTTGIKEEIVSPIAKTEGFFTKARRAFSKFLYKIDTNKENKPPLGKAF